MSPLTIYRDNPTNTTLVSNRFIDDYMKDANDAQLKIYLYLIRMLGSDIPTSVSDIADKFNHTEKDVLRALKYWEKNRLISLDYNTSKALVGIQLQDLNHNSNEHALTTDVITFTPIVPGAKTSKAEEIQTEAQPTSSPMKAQSKQIVTLPSQKLTQIEPTDVLTFEKPQYSLDQMKDFRSRSETAEILFITEQYIGKPLSVKDVQTIFFFYDKLNFSTDLIDYLIQYCVERGKKDFKYIEAVAISWAEQKITTAKQASSNSKKYDKTVYTVMKSLGKSGVPTTKEMVFINKWTSSFQFNLEIIIEACDRTVLAVDNHRFEYANSILENWNKQDIHTKSDIENSDKLFHSNRSSKSTVLNSTGKNATNKFNQFTQRSYDFEQLEKELLSN